MSSSGDNGIVVFCTDGNVMFNSSGELIENVKKVRKYKNMGNILFPIFNKMLEFTDNDFWIKLLGKLSKNKFPKNFSYVNETISYKSKTKKKQSTFKIDENNLEESFNLMREFFKERGVLPYEEKLEILPPRNEKIIERWKDVSKNKINYIYDFIEKMTQKYDLNSHEKTNLFSILRIGIAGDIFNDETIHIENDSISEIDFLGWNSSNREFYIDKIFYNPKKYKTIKKDNTNFSTYSSSCSTYKKTKIDQSPPLIEYSKMSAENKWKKFLSEFYKL